MHSPFYIAFMISVFWVGPAVGQTVVVDTTSQLAPTTRDVGKYSIGLDIFKNIPYLLIGNQLPRPLYRATTMENQGIVEIMARKQTSANQYLTVLVGFARSEIEYTEKVETRDRVSGWYGKVGKEWVMGKADRSSIGLSGMATYCTYQTDYRFEGPVFGDYLGTGFTRNVGVGIESYLGYDIPLSPRFLLRWITRLSLHHRLAGVGDTPYYPGVGIVFDSYDPIVSFGTTLQLHYRFVGKKGDR